MAHLEMFGGIYRLAATGCAEALFRAPWAEPAFVRLSRHGWNAPAAGRFLRSVAYRLASRLFDSGHGVRDVAVGGVILRLDVGEWTTFSPYFANHLYEPVTVDYLTTHLRAGDVFVDIGANSGYFTVLASALVGAAGRVVAFEPNPTVRRRLERNIARNGGGTRVRVEGCALSDRTAEHVRLYVPEHDGFATLVPDQTHASSYLSGANAIDVRTSTFDDWYAASGLESIAVMKVDVEGGEPQVLAGMARTLAAGSIARLILETAWDGEPHRTLVRYGYTPERLESVGPVDNIAYTRP